VLKKTGEFVEKHSILLANYFSITMKFGELLAKSPFFYFLFFANILNRGSFATLFYRQSILLYGILSWLRWLFKIFLPIVATYKFYTSPLLSLPFYFCDADKVHWKIRKSHKKNYANIYRLGSQPNNTLFNKYCVLLRLPVH